VLFWSISLVIFCESLSLEQQSFLALSQQELVSQTLGTVSLASRQRSWSCLLNVLLLILRFSKQHFLKHSELFLKVQPSKTLVCLVFIQSIVFSPQLVLVLELTFQIQILTRRLMQWHLHKSVHLTFLMLFDFGE
jgi:hypothetical protein